jgi:hypothetical protein
MKAKRWSKEKCAEMHDAHLLVLSSKLMEESAEVSKEITKAPFRKNGLDKEALLIELSHVEIMTGIIRSKLFGEKVS